MKRVLTGALALALTVGLTGCVQQDLESSLPPALRERVDAVDFEVRVGATATPGLNTLNVGIVLDRDPTAADLRGVLDAVFETSSLPMIYTLSVRAFPAGDEPCLDLSPAIAELGLTAFEFTVSAADPCARLLGDPDAIREVWASW